MSFSSDLKRYAKNLDISLEEVAVAVCSTAAKLIIEKTPVDKGGAKANWVATINTPYNGVVKTKDKSGAIAISKAIKTAGNASGNVFYLTNNLPYIRKLEYGGYNEGKKIIGGFSTQAPAGMVRISMMELKAYVRKYK